MKEYEQHEIGKCYPALSEGERKLLRFYLRSTEPVSAVCLYEGKILDGWHQYLESKAMGRECEFEEVNPPDPIAFVVQRNEGRRQLTQGQRVVIADKLATLKRGGDRGNQYTGGKPSSEGLPKSGRGMAVDHAAKLMGVSATSIGFYRQARKRGIPEVIEAVDKGEIKVRTAAGIADLPKEEQASALEKAKEDGLLRQERILEGSFKPLADSPPGVVPPHLMRGIITADMVGKGFTVCSDIEGNPCHLPPDVSELEFKERAATEIGGSPDEKHRKAAAKWDRYIEQRVRSKVLKVLALMSPLEVEAGQFSPALHFEYDLEKAADLEELVTMLSADLQRLVYALKLREKYGKPEDPPLSKFLNH